MNNGTRFRISIAEDFSRYPAGRFPSDGKNNGTRFRRHYLVPRLKGVKGSASDMVEVNFDGVAGLGSSFLEEAFGGLVREEGMSKEFLDQHLKIVTSENDLKDFVLLAQEYIQKAHP